MTKTIFTLLTLALLMSSCSDEDSSQEFRVTVQNNFQAKEYFSNGGFDFFGPGSEVSFSFDAGKGHYLQLASMFVQSNDVFVAADEQGIMLYDQNSTALSGDITSMFDLWDAGTEVNEAPGMGPNQAPRQSGANTGPTENGTVLLLANVNDGFNYPELTDLLNINISHDGSTRFTVTIQNISNGSTLASPFAPGTWVIQSEGQSALFSEGSSASSALEALAEDGSNGLFSSQLSMQTGLVSPFAPGAYSVSDINDVFTRNTTSSSALEALAEDGDPSNYSNIFNTPISSSSPGPIFPNDSYSFSFSAQEGDKLSVALMLVQSNDWFIGINELELFTNGQAVSGNVTSSASVYDSGTEQNEYRGAGPNQPPRQSSGNTGPAENGSVSMVDLSANDLPSVGDMIKINIEVIN